MYTLFVEACVMPVEKIWTIIYHMIILIQQATKTFTTDSVCMPVNTMGILSI